MASKRFEIFLALAGGAAGLYILQHAFPPETLHGYFVRCNMTYSGGYIPLAHGPGTFMVDFFPENVGSKVGLNLTAVGGAEGHSYSYDVCQKIGYTPFDCGWNGWSAERTEFAIPASTSALVRLKNGSVLRGAPQRPATDFGAPITIIVRTNGVLGGPPVQYDDCAFR